jgi:hypothetical protein
MSAKWTGVKCVFCEKGTEFLNIIRLNLVLLKS